MPLILMFFKSYWRQIIGLIAILTVLFTIGHSIYSWGYNNSEKSWEARIKKRDEVAAAQAVELKSLSTSLADARDALTKQNADNLAKILAGVKGKPLIVVGPTGKCELTTDFSKAYKDIIMDGIIPLKDPSKK